MILVLGVWTFLRALLGSSAAVTLENVALRHQLAVLQRSVGRSRLRRWDRLVWVGLSQLWAGWRAKPPHRSARDRPCLAPSRLPALLALEVPGPLSGSPAARS
jgi:hypothetical protein